MTILALREARRHVRNFSDESELMRNHDEAIDCLDCEAFLQLGIDAFDWLIRADQTIRRATFDGEEYDHEADATLQVLFRAWLKPCDFATGWVAAQKQRGYNLSNLEEFRRCECEVRAIVRSFDADAMTDAMRDLRDSAVTEYRDGKTAEFI